MGTTAGSPAATAPRTPKIKLQPPRRPSAYIWRPRLERILDAAVERRVTTVVAGPGFGKSTLVAARALEHGWVWYSADSTDAALGVFGRGLRDALFPGAVAPIPEEALRADADGLAVAFGQALDAVLEQDLVLVLDDVHELGAETESARFLERLSRQAPAELHLVLCSREEAPFPIERLHGQGQAVRIDSAALAFTAEEVEVLLLDVDPELAAVSAELHKATGGWPAAIQLGAHMLATAPTTAQEASLSALERRGGPLFAYLADEVFRREAPEVIELLRAVALFERFTPELCAALRFPDPSVTLAHLERRGFVIVGGAAESLRLHPLLREFVVDAWPLPLERRRELQGAAAAWSESEGLLAQALALWRDANQPEEIVRLFDERWNELLNGGYVAAVVDAAAAVPTELMNEPAMYLVTASYGVLGESELELRSLEELAQREQVPSWVSFHLGDLYLIQGRYREAIETLLDVEEIHAARPFFRRLFPTGAAVAMHHAFAAYGYQHLGELELSREYSLRALAQARETGFLTAEVEAQMNLADLALLDGHVAAAENHLKTALELATRAENVLAECSARTRTALLRLAQGRYVDALSAAEDSLALAERIGFALFLAWALVVRGRVQHALGRLEEAAADLALSARRYERLGSGPPRAWVLLRLAEMHGERGDLAQARAAGEAALAIGEQSEDLGLHETALAVLGRVIAAEEPERAAELAERAVQRGGPYVGEPLLARGWIALLRADHDAAAADASAAVSEARRLSRRDLLAEALELRAFSGRDGQPQLEEALTVWRELGNPIAETRVELALAARAGTAAEALRLRKKLGSLGVRDGAFRTAGPLQAIGDEGASLVVIKTLGGFAVVRSGDPVPAGEWKSRKARDLLKCLVAARGRPLAREQLIEALWPGEPPERTGNRLSVALSTARSVLDPERRFDPDHLVSAEEGTIRLRLDHVAVDVEAFLAEADAALRVWRQAQTPESRGLLAEAEQSYGGDFLAEDRYEVWASPLRDEARGAYLDIARALAAATEGREAARYYRRILDVDEYDEEAHVGLVATLARAGGHGEARRAYTVYTSRMAEIGVEPIALAELTGATRPAAARR